MCDVEAIDAPSILRVIRNTTSLVRILPTFDLRRTSRVCSGTDHGRIAQAELLKLQKSGQFPDETVRINDTPVHYVNSQTY